MSWVTDCKWESTRDEASEVCRRREKSLDFILNTVGIHEKVLHWERHDDVLVLKDHFSCCIAKPVKCSQISIWEITVTLIRAAVGKMHRISSKLYLRCRTSKTRWDQRGEWKGGVDNNIHVSGFSEKMNEGVIHQDKNKSAMVCTGPKICLNKSWKPSKKKKKRILEWVAISSSTGYNP